MSLGRPAALLGAVLLSALTSSCSLILDFDTPLTDGGPSPFDSGPDAVPVVDAGADMFEPNDDTASATVITPGTYEPLSIFPRGDVDYFHFTLTEMHDVMIDCNFTWQDGDLDMLLFNSAFMQIDQATHFDQDEHIYRTGASALPAGDYYIEVLGFENNFTNTYTLVLTVI
jgi:hypothetical protein